MDYVKSFILTVGIFLAIAVGCVSFVGIIVLLTFLASTIGVAGVIGIVLFLLAWYTVHDARIV